MKIQFISFPGCPNAEGARAELDAALSRIDLPLEIELIDTTSAGCPVELRAWGSPTILVDGEDVGGQQRSDAASCRLYADSAPGKPGVPSRSSIVAVIERALSARGGAGEPGRRR